MSKYAEQCGARNPETLRGTLFRKQVATKIMEKGFDHTTVEKLSNYLGHTKNVHIGSYRKSVLKRDLETASILREAQSPIQASSKNRITKNQPQEMSKQAETYDELNHSDPLQEINTFDEPRQNEILHLTSSSGKKFICVLTKLFFYI